MGRFPTETVREALLRLLGDTSAPVREAALAGLAYQPWAAAVGPVCQRLRDPEAAIRRQASAILIQWRDPQTIVHLLDLLQDPHPDVRLAAGEVLGAVGTPETFRAAVRVQGDTAITRDILLALLMDTNTAVRKMALAGLEELQVPVDAEPLYDLLRDRDFEVRCQAVALLTQRHDPHNLHYLLTSLQDESDIVRQSAIAVLNAIASPVALRELLDTLHDTDAWFKVGLVEALGISASPALVDAALILVSDNDACIRRSAVEILQRRQDERAFQTLLAALEQPDTWGVRCAMEALAALRDKRAVPALLRRLSSRDTDVSQTAVRALAALGDPQAVDPLLALLQHGDRAMREEILGVLVPLTDATRASTVLQAVWAIRETSSAAFKALANGTAAALIRRFGEQVVHGPGAREAHTMVCDISSAELATPRITLSPPPSAPLTVPEALVSVLPTATLTPAARLDVAALNPGTLLAQRYRVIRQIGRGGFGTVFLVEDTTVREHIILKFLNPHVAANKVIVNRFINELRYARQVTHPNVIRLHDFLTFGDVYAISMEYFPGRNLAQDLTGRQPMSLKRGLKIVFDICSGMVAAHQAHVVHRDLKPPNILINDNDVVKIVDFGLATAVHGLETRLTRTGVIMGTPAYMAPEQVRGNPVDARTDIYSLGVIMYEMFTGRQPYVGETPLSVLFQHVEGNIVSPRARNPQVLPALEAIILKTMAVQPEQRFQSMEELRRQIVALAKSLVGASLVS